MQYTVRVATFSWSSGTSWVSFPGTFDGAALPGNLVSAPHYQVLHVDPTTTPGAATAAWAAVVDRFYSDQTSQAIQELAAATDLDGNSLLDNTVVVYLSEIARGWDHNQMNVPFLVFGGKNTRIRGGTFLKITDGPLPGQTGLTSSGGTGNRPVNDAWLALASNLRRQPGFAWQSHPIHRPFAGAGRLSRLPSRNPLPGALLPGTCRARSTSCSKLSTELRDENGETYATSSGGCTLVHADGCTGHLGFGRLHRWKQQAHGDYGAQRQHGGQEEMGEVPERLRAESGRGGRARRGDHHRAGLNRVVGRAAVGPAPVHHAGEQGGGRHAAREVLGGGDDVKRRLTRLAQRQVRVSGDRGRLQ